MTWVTSYSVDQKATKGQTCPGLRVGGGEGRTERGEITGEGVLCLAMEAWDGEWQENTETVGRAVGRSQLSLCVCNSLDIPQPGPGTGTDCFSILGFTYASRLNMAIPVC